MENSQPTFTISSLVRSNIRELKPYSSARDEFKGNAQVFLDANENPFPSEFNRYPDSHQFELKQKVASIKGVSVENVFLGNGSDEAIDLIIRAFCEPNCDSILINEPTYGMYAVCANINAVKVISVPLSESFDLDIASIKGRIDQGTKIIFLCSPNNPTGNLLSEEKIISLLNDFPGIVVIDEAYIDFAETESFVNKIQTYPNLIVLQTFSKAWGLAALRLGVAVASEEIIGILHKIKMPYNVNNATAKHVVDTLEKTTSTRTLVDEILRERRRTKQTLENLSSVVNVFQSDANFLLVKFQDAKKVYRHLINYQIVVRDRSHVQGCHNCLRITIGMPAENDRLIKALQAL